MSYENMKKCSSTDLKKLRGLAHHLNPVVWVGQQGVTDALVKSTAEALLAHELIKVKFVDHKDEVGDLADDLATKTDSVVAGVIGHIAILYREQPEEGKRRIKVNGEK